MTTKLTLAGPDDLDRILSMVAAFQAAENIDNTDEQRRSGVLPLLEGSPHGAIWLIGPARAPVGYIAICFGWSLEFGGLDGFIDEFYIREAIRGRGMGTEVLQALLPQLAEAGLRALHLEVSRNNPAEKLYSRIGFQRRDTYSLMSWVAQSPEDT